MGQPRCVLLLDMLGVLSWKCSLVPKAESECSRHGRSLTQNATCVSCMPTLILADCDSRAGCAPTIMLNVDMDLMYNVSERSTSCGPFGQSCVVTRGLDASNVDLASSENENHPVEYARLFRYNQTAWREAFVQAMSKMNELGNSCLREVQQVPSVSPTRSPENHTPTASPSSGPTSTPATTSPTASPSRGPTFHGQRVQTILVRVECTQRYYRCGPAFWQLHGRPDPNPTLQLTAGWNVRFDLRSVHRNEHNLRLWFGGQVLIQVEGGTMSSVVTIPYPSSYLGSPFYDCSRHGSNMRGIVQLTTPPTTGAPFSSAPTKSPFTNAPSTPHPTSSPTPCRTSALSPLYSSTCTRGGFVSIAATGVALARVSACDDCTQRVPLPFAFSWYGVEAFSTIDVSSNGLILLRPEDYGQYECCSAQPIVPGNASSRSRISIAHEDLDPSSAGTIYYEDTGRGSVIVSFEGVGFYDKGLSTASPTGK